MKVLIDPLLIIEYVLNRENDIKQESDKLWKFLSEKPPHIQTYLSQYGLEKIYNICKIKSQKCADNLINKLESLVVIYESSPKVFKQIREYQGDIDAAIELYSAIEMNCSALITTQTNKYINPSSSLSILTVTELLENLDNCDRNFLENKINLTNEDYFECCIQTSKSKQLTIIPNSDIINYRFRNSIQSVLEALNLLKEEGYQGLTKEQLREKMKKSMNTINNIVWDLCHTEMIEIHNNKQIRIKPALLDTNKQDISKYIAIVLKKHFIVEKIYRYLKGGNLLNRQGLLIMIKETYSDSNCELTDKTLIDYRSRLCSWLKFANLLEERGDTTLRIPNQDYNNQCVENIQLSQLTLFDLSKYTKYFI